MSTETERQLFGRRTEDGDTIRVEALAGVGVTVAVVNALGEGSWAQTSIALSYDGLRELRNALTAELDREVRERVASGERKIAVLRAAEASGLSGPEAASRARVTGLPTRDRYGVLHDGEAG